MSSSPAQLLGWGDALQRGDWECGTAMTIPNVEARGAEFHTSSVHICSRDGRTAAFTSPEQSVCSDFSGGPALDFLLQLGSLFLLLQMSVRNDLPHFVLFFVFLSLFCFSSSWENKSEKWFPSTRTTQLFPLPPEAVSIQDRKDPVSPLLRYDSEIYGNI